MLEITDKAREMLDKFAEQADGDCRAGTQPRISEEDADADRAETEDPEDVQPRDDEHLEQDQRKT